MLIESLIEVMILLGFFVFGLIGIRGWIVAAERLDKEKQKNKELQYQVKVLKHIIANKNARENIKVANEYNKEN